MRTSLVQPVLVGDVHRHHPIFESIKESKYWKSQLTLLTLCCETGTRTTSIYFCCRGETDDGN